MSAEVLAPYSGGPRIHEDWRDAAACQGKTDLFYPPDLYDTDNLGIEDAEGAGNIDATDDNGSQNTVAADEVIGLKPNSDPDAILSKETTKKHPAPREPKKDREAREKVAKAICVRCPVVYECLLHALKTEEEHGIWGGLTERERRAYLKKINNNNLQLKPHGYRFAG